MIEAPEEIEADEAGPYIEPSEDDRRWWSQYGDHDDDSEDADDIDRRAAEAEWLDAHECGWAAI